MNSAALAVLTEAGISGVDAEIALRRLLAQLTAPSPAQRRAMEDLGLTPDALDPSVESIADVIVRLAAEELEETVAAAIVGAENTTVLLALTKGVHRLRALQPSED